MRYVPFLSKILRRFSDPRLDHSRLRCSGRYVCPFHVCQKALFNSPRDALTSTMDRFRLLNAISMKSLRRLRHQSFGPR